MAFSFKRIGSMLDDPENRRLEGLLSTAPAPAPAPAPVLNSWVTQGDATDLANQERTGTLAAANTESGRIDRYETTGLPDFMWPKEESFWRSLGFDGQVMTTGGATYNPNINMGADGNFEREQAAEGQFTPELLAFIQQRGLQPAVSREGDLMRYGVTDPTGATTEAGSWNGGDNTFWNAAQLASMAIGQGVNTWAGLGNGMGAAPAMVDPSRIDAYGMPASDGIKTLGTIPAGTGPVAPLETMGTVDPMAGVPSAPTVPPAPTMTTPPIMEPPPSFNTPQLPGTPEIMAPPVTNPYTGPTLTEPMLPAAPSMLSPTMTPPPSFDTPRLPDTPEISAPPYEYQPTGPTLTEPSLPAAPSMLTPTGTAPTTTPTAPTTPTPEPSPLDKFTTWAKANPTEAKLLFGAAGGLLGGSGGGGGGGYSYDGPIPTVSREGWSPTAAPKTDGGMLAPPSGGGGMLGGMNIKRGEPNSGLWRYLGLLGG